MCKQLLTVERSNCTYTLAGIDRLWVSEFNEDLDYSIIGEELIINSTLDWKELELDKGVGGNGSFVNETSLTINGYIGKATVTSNYSMIDGSKWKQLRRMLNKKMYCLVLDNNGKFWFLGIESGVKVSTITSTTGTKGDYNGYTLVLVSTSTNPYNVSEIIVEGEFNNDFNFDFLTA
jgi:hypothetical protein